MKFIVQCRVSLLRCYVLLPPPPPPEMRSLIGLCDPHCHPGLVFVVVCLLCFLKACILGWNSCPHAFKTSILPSEAPSQPFGFYLELPPLSFVVPIFSGFTFLRLSTFWSSYVILFLILYFNLVLDFVFCEIFLQLYFLILPLSFSFDIIFSYFISSNCPHILFCERISHHSIVIASV